jgi:hypothetical protein
VSTNALEVKGALFALIKALPEFVDAQVTYGVPRRIEKTWCALGRVRWDSSEWATNRGREETFTVEGLVSIIRTAGNAETTEADAVRLGSAIEAAVMSAPNFGNPRIVTSGFKPVSVSSFPNDAEGFEAQYEWTVSVTARI